MILLIVESPTKVKTIEKFLGKEYKVVSSYGHICNLSKNKNSVEIINDKVQLEYELLEKADKIIADLKKEAKKASLILLATDNDREGEAIAWHLHNFLGLEKLNKGKKIECQRIVFNQISEKAIKTAIKNPTRINMNLVNAQQARRTLDRLVGFKLSLFLWKKITKGLSAGRVQSVALKVVADREKEIKVFKPEEHWKIGAILRIKKEEKIEAFLIKKNKVNVKLKINSKQVADEISRELEKAEWTVLGVKKKETKKAPPAPFITSSLQQEASQRLGYSIKKTMMVAQKLYEKGYITYHRTDSFNLSNEIIEEAKKFIKKEYGEKYYCTKKRIYKKGKSSQEAHEAIRPVKINSDNADNEPLYKLIKKRFLASQMSDALFYNKDIESVAVYKKNNYTFITKGVVLIFKGFLVLYNNDKEEEENKELPEIREGKTLILEKLLTEQYFTKPLSRYTESSLVRELEKNGIGRPSTYASIISIIQVRNYVFKNEDKKLEPTDIGTLVSDFLEEHLPSIVDFKFTAKMENNLDKIAEGSIDWEKIIIDFYYPFTKILDLKELEIDKDKIVNFGDAGEKCSKCGSKMIIKIGRYGKFMACSKYPECKNSKKIKSEKEKLNRDVNGDALKTGEVCEKCSSEMIIKTGRYGEFLGCSSYPNCKNIKSIVKKIGIKCPLCEKGDLIEKRTRTRRTFYGCTNYPICNFALWQKPINERCEKCYSLLIEMKTGKKCSNKDCLKNRKI